MGRTSDAKNRLLDSAGKLLRERGYNAVGISDICREAGVNKGSFYHFFPSKQDLALEVIDDYWHVTRETLERDLLGAGSPLGRLRRFFEKFYEQHRQDCSLLGQQQGCPLANLATEMSTQDPVVRQRVLQAFEAQIGYFEQLLRQATRRGELDDRLDTRAAAESIVALIEGRILLAKLRNDFETLKNLADDAFRLLKT